MFHNSIIKTLKALNRLPPAQIIFRYNKIINYNSYSIHSYTTTTEYLQKCCQCLQLQRQPTQRHQQQVLSATLRKQLFSATTIHMNSFYKEKTTRFNGIHITIENMYQSSDVFEQTLVDLLERYKKDRRRSVFIEIPIEQSHLIKVAYDHGFMFHHARNKTSVLSLWLEEDTVSKIPSFANHQVGVAGACFNSDTDELLVVQDKGKFSNWWKCPGGFSDIGEYIGETAVRETFEETGVKSEFKSILSLRQQHNVRFGQSDFYFICRLQPLTYEITMCPDEIVDCDWIHVNELLKMDNATPFVKLLCRLLIKGKATGFDNIDMIGTEMDSWIAKKKFLIYHRPEFH